MHKIFVKILALLVASSSYAAFPVGNTAAFQKETYDFYARVKQNGGDVSSRSLIYASRWSLGLKELNIRTNLVWAHLFLGYTTNAAQVPYIKDMGATVITNSGFTTNEWSEYSSFIGDSSSYLRTGLIPDDFATTASGHVSVYNIRATDTGALDIGASEGVGTESDLYIRDNSGSNEAIFDSYDSSTRLLSPVALDNFTGFLIGSRTATDYAFLASATTTAALGIEVDTMDAVSGTVPSAREYYIYAQNNQGTEAAPTDRAYGTVTFGYGMSFVTASNLCRLTQSFNSNVRVLPPSEPTNNLVAYWRMDEASSPWDDVKGGYDFTTSLGSPGSAVGIITNAVEFAGAEASVNITSAAIPFGNSSFTLGFWFYVDQAAASSSELGFQLILDSFGFFVFSYDGPTERTQINLPTGADVVGMEMTTTEAWHLFIGWYDASTGKFNINVDDSGTVTSTESFAAGAEHGDVQLIGGQFYEGEAFIGRIDEVFFYRRVLTSAEQTTLWNSGAGVTYPSVPTP